MPHIPPPDFRALLDGEIRVHDLRFDDVADVVRYIDDEFVGGGHDFARIESLLHTTIALLQRPPDAWPRRWKRFTEAARIETTIRAVRSYMAVTRVRAPLLALGVLPYGRMLLKQSWSGMAPGLLAIEMMNVSVSADRSARLRRQLVDLRLPAFDELSELGFEYRARSHDLAILEGDMLAARWHLESLILPYSADFESSGLTAARHTALARIETELPGGDLDKALGHIELAVGYLDGHARKAGRRHDVFDAYLDIALGLLCARLGEDEDVWLNYLSEGTDKLRATGIDVKEFAKEAVAALERAGGAPVP